MSSLVYVPSPPSVYVIFPYISSRWPLPCVLAIEKFDARSFWLSKFRGKAISAAKRIVKSVYKATGVSSVGIANIMGEEGVGGKSWYQRWKIPKVSLSRKTSSPSQPHEATNDRVFPPLPLVQYSRRFFFLGSDRVNAPILPYLPCTYIDMHTSLPRIIPTTKSPNQTPGYEKVDKIENLEICPSPRPKRPRTALHSMDTRETTMPSMIGPTQRKKKRRKKVIKSRWWSERGGGAREVNSTANQTY